MAGVETELVEKAVVSGKAGVEIELVEQAVVWGRARVETELVEKAVVSGRAVLETELVEKTVVWFQVNLRLLEMVPNDSPYPKNMGFDTKTMSLACPEPKLEISSSKWFWASYIPFLTFRSI